MSLGTEVSSQEAKLQVKTESFQPSMVLPFKFISRRGAGRSYVPKEDLGFTFSLEQNS